MTWTRPTTWDQCLGEMPQTLLARELLQAYHDLEKLYWKEARLFCFAFGRRRKRELGLIRMRILEQKVHIQWLGGRVPPRFSW